MAGPVVYMAHYLNTKAECAAKLGDWTVAERSARDALELGTTHGSQDAVAAAHVALAQSSSIAVRGRRAAALKAAAEIYRGLGAKSELADVLMRLSRNAKARNDLVEAERFATLAFEATRSVSVLMEVKK